MNHLAILFVYVIELVMVSEWVSGFRDPLKNGWKSDQPNYGIKLGHGSRTVSNLPLPPPFEGPSAPNMTGSLPRRFNGHQVDWFPQKKERRKKGEFASRCKKDFCR